MRDKKFVILVLILTGIILLNLPAAVSGPLKAFFRDNLAPFQMVVRGVGDWLHDTGGRVMDVAGSAGEKRDMVTRIARLREEVRRLSALEQENLELRDVIGFRARSAHRLLACEVVGRGDATGWWQTLTLNRGQADGVSTNLAVLSLEGLIGRTAEVSRHTSTVMLLSDPQCKVACRFGRTGGFGILRGGGVRLSGDPDLELISGIRPMRMDYVSKDMRVFDSDDVVTSGLGGVYPEGLRIGRVLRSEMDSSGLYQRAEIELAADLGKVRYAFVMLPDLEGRP